MKTRPFLKMYPLFSRINCIHKQGSEQRTCYLPKVGDTGCLQHLFYRRKDNMRILENSFSYLLHCRMIVQLAFKTTKWGWETNIHRSVSHFSMSVGYNFTNGNPRLGRWLTAELGLELQFSDSWFGSFLLPVAAWHSHCWCRRGTISWYLKKYFYHC